MARETGYPNLAEPNRKPSNRQQASISRHPLFPAIVALWFAALLGMGSFALSTSLIETLVLAGNVDRLIPAAAPPLGATARLLLALALGIAGGALGWLLALRLAETKEAAPAPQVFKVAETDLVPPAPWTPPATQDAPAFIAEAAEEAPVAEAAPTPTAAERIASAELAELSHVELVERLAIAIQRRQERLDGAPTEAAEPTPSVVRFPDLADRQSARLIPPSLPAHRAPQETEKALREALAALQRMSGSG